jgi:sulfur-carrier protein
MLVILPTPLLRLFPGCPRETTIAAANVADMIDALDRQIPGIKDRICDSTPKVRRHINIFVDGERATLETPLTPAMEVFIMTAISGG